MKILDGRELAGFIKERQVQIVGRLRAEGKIPKLMIIRDNNHPVISKYVELKRQYGEDIGIEVEDVLINLDDDIPKNEIAKQVSRNQNPEGLEKLKQTIKKANQESSISGIIVQLPLKNSEWTEEVVNSIAPEKDVDGLSGKGKFDSATATAINWLLAGHNIDLSNKKIAIVGRGRLVGGPLIKMWKNSGYEIEIFGRDADLKLLNKFDVIVSATGIPHLIKSEMVRSGSVVVDAGTASEDGMIIGDIDEEIRLRRDLLAITPKIGGVGPLTVAVLFEDVIAAATKNK